MKKKIVLYHIISGYMHKANDFSINTVDVLKENKSSYDVLCYDRRRILKSQLGKNLSDFGINIYTLDLESSLKSVTEIYNARLKYAQQELEICTKNLNDWVEFLNSRKEL